MPSPIVTNTTAGLNGKRISLLEDFIIYRPEDYGAIGDGVTNDSVAIQNCINAALLIGGTVLFGAKVYVVSTIINIQQNGGRPIKIVGQGKTLDLQVSGISGTTIKFVGGAPVDALFYVSNGNSLEIRGFSLDCGAVTKAAIGLLIQNCVGSIFDNIHILNSSAFAFELFADTAGIYRNRFTNLSTDKTCVSALRCRSSNLAVFNVDVASNNFIRCDFFYTGAGGAVGIDLKSADNNLFSGVSIDCVNGTAAGEAIWLEDATAAQFGAAYNVFTSLDGGSLAGTARGIKADSTLPNVCYGYDFANGLGIAATSLHSEKFFRNDTTGVLNTKLLQFIDGTVFGASTVPFQIYYDSSAQKVRLQTHDPGTIRGFIFSGNAGAGAESVLFEIDNAGKIYERGRAVASGDFTYPAWVAGNFTTSGGGWTTIAGTTKLGISRRGTTALAKFNITGSTVVNAGNLQMSLVPFGLVVSAQMNFTNTCRIVDNGGAAVSGLVSAIASDNKIIVQLMAGTGFAVSAANTSCSGELQFETTT